MKSEPNPEEALLPRLLYEIAHRHDHAAFGTLFDVVAPRIKAMLMRSGSSGATAEDVMQDVMVKVWTKAGLFDPQRGTAMGWLYTLVRNARVDYLRKHRPGLSVELADWDAIDWSPLSDDVVVEKQVVVHVRRAIGVLAAEQMQMVEMAYVQGFSQSEISQKLSLPLGTVKSRLRLAYAKLRKELEKLK